MTNPDTRERTNAAPVISLPDPADISYHQDHEAVALATDIEALKYRHSALVAVRVGRLVRDAFGAEAHRVLFDRNYTDDGGTNLNLIAVLDADGQPIWYDDDRLQETGLVRAREQQAAAGTFVLPELDPDTAGAITQIAEMADDIGSAGGYLTMPSFYEDRDGKRVAVHYDPVDGEVVELVIPEEEQRLARYRRDMMLVRLSEEDAECALNTLADYRRGVDPDDLSERQNEVADRVVALAAELNEPTTD